MENAFGIYDKGLEFGNIRLLLKLNYAIHKANANQKLIRKIW